MKPWVLAFWLLAVGACAQPAALPVGPMAAGASIALSADPVALNPDDVSLSRVGHFTYSGGLNITSKATSRLHGLSDLRVMPSGALYAESDEGGFFSARLVRDPKGRLVSLKDGELTALIGVDGKPLPSKQESDAEGLAILENGDRLISFERHHRILLYPAQGGSPHEVPSPQANFPNNGGMEGLAANPAKGPDAYMVGGEVSGETWNCTLSKGCEPGRVISKPDDFKLVALAPLPGSRLAYLLRAWDPIRGSRISLVIAAEDGGVIDQLDLQPPLTVDNFEGLAALPGKDGAVRFYLISDDNFEPSQRTLLLAFDWKPSPAGPKAAAKG